MTLTQYMRLMDEAPNPDEGTTDGGGGGESPANNSLPGGVDSPAVEKPEEEWTDEDRKAEFERDDSKPKPQRKQITTPTGVDPEKDRPTQKPSEPPAPAAAPAPHSGGAPQLEVLPRPAAPSSLDIGKILEEGLKEIGKEKLKGADGEEVTVEQFIADFPAVHGIANLLVNKALGAVVPKLLEHFESRLGPMQQSFESQQRASERSSLISQIAARDEVRALNLDVGKLVDDPSFWKWVDERPAMAQLMDSDQPELHALAIARYAGETGAAGAAPARPAAAQAADKLRGDRQALHRTSIRPGSQGGGTPEMKFEEEEEEAKRQAMEEEEAERQARSRR
jgi:hypothetical protein